MKARLLLGCVAAFLCSATASATPFIFGSITYTMSSTASGTLGASSFTNQLVTISITGDTLDPWYYTAEGTVQIGMAAPVNLTDGYKFFVSQTYGLLSPVALIKGFYPEFDYGDYGSFGYFPIYDTFSDDFKTYGGYTSIGPIVGNSYYSTGIPFSTAEGALIFNSGGPESTFKATFQGYASPDPDAVTPEPSSLLLLGTGILGTIGILKKKLTGQKAEEPERLPSPFRLIESTGRELTSRASPAVFGKLTSGSRGRDCCGV